MSTFQIFDRRICRFFIAPDAFFWSKIASWKHPPTDPRPATGWLQNGLVSTQGVPFGRAILGCFLTSDLLTRLAPPREPVGYHQPSGIHSYQRLKQQTNKQLQTETVNFNPIQNGHVISFSRRHLSYLHFVVCIVCLWCLWWFHLMFRWTQPLDRPFCMWCQRPEAAGLDQRIFTESHRNLLDELMSIKLRHDMAVSVR